MLDRLGGRILAARGELQLPPADVAPGAELPADPAIDADRSESEALVKGDAGVVRKGDPGAGGAVAALAESVEQPLVEEPTHSLAATAVGDIHGDIRRPPVRRPRAMRAAVGEA